MSRRSEGTRTHKLKCVSLGEVFWWVGKEWGNRGGGSCKKRLRCPSGAGNWRLWKAGTETLHGEEKEVGIDCEILNYL